MMKGTSFEALILVGKCKIASSFVGNDLLSKTICLNRNTLPDCGSKDRYSAWL
jgi:hypothetical protein